MGKMRALIFFIVFRQASAVLYHLNDTEYHRMPPIFHLDPYKSCLQQNGTYCSVQIDLVEGNRELMKMILEYSERKETHFNHTRLNYGICVSKKCSKHLNNYKTDNLRLAVEGCLNDTFWEEYRLRLRLNEDPICADKENIIELEPVDIAAAVVFISLIMLNVVATIYDVFILKENAKGNEFLLCFSIKRNLDKLTKAPENGTESISLTGLNGLKAITIFLVVVEHAPLTLVIALDNTHDFEKMFDNILHHVLLDGPVVVQTFFVISGCLLAYQLQRISERENLTWTTIPKAILLRFLRINTGFRSLVESPSFISRRCLAPLYSRLTPTYAIVLIFTMTWIRFVGSGPFWQKMIGPEVHDCRHYGWMNLLYVNNYYDNTQCMTHSWYLAADMQLYVLGVVFLLLAKSNRARKIVLSLLFVVGFCLPAFHTYFQNLHASTILAPEVARSHFVKDPTFNNSHKRGHLNVSCYIIGISLGLLIYRLEQKKFEISAYRKYRFLYWAIVPAMVGIILFSSIFYMQGISAPLILKAIYSSISRPAFGLLIFFFILGMAFKLEDVYRPLLEWKGWTAPSKVSFSAYLLHLAFIQVATASRATLFHVTPVQLMILCTGTSLSTFILAFPFWMIVEAPLREIAKIILIRGFKKKTPSDPETGNSKL